SSAARCSATFGTGVWAITSRRTPVAATSLATSSLGTVASLNGLSTAVACRASSGSTTEIDSTHATSSSPTLSGSDLLLAMRYVPDAASSSTTPQSSDTTQNTKS